MRKGNGFCVLCLWVVWAIKLCTYMIYMKTNQSDRIAQWISAFDFGSKGRGFDSHCGRLS